MERPHILVIEDDNSICDLLYTTLTKAEHRVSVAKKGEQGLAQIEEDPPHLVVLDLNLPGMNGLDVCRVMRRDPWMSKIPVLMLTAKAEEEDVVAGLEVGADDYMTKPFSTKVLLARVKMLLRRSGQYPADLTPDGPLSSEQPELLIVKTLGAAEFLIAGQRLSWTEELSPSQRQLLSILVCSPAARISQEDIQVFLWPNSSAKKARSSFDSLLMRVRSTFDKKLAPFDSKAYLLMKRGYLCLQNARIDIHEFRRLINKANRQLALGEVWPAEISFSSAFSLWQGRFLPGGFGIDMTIAYQEDLEQVYLEASLTFARLLQESGRLPQACKLLFDALRFDPTQDEIIRQLYRLSLVQENFVQANKILKQYAAALHKEHYPPDEICDILDGIKQG